ncbi:RNA polymerase-binding protein DksA [uncultured Methylibium sp.]|uniref:RNA polymerase-binding protein DksA n=1 Tax=uncultured Methylibium sp. TaxID=381093 RepID=UPI0025E54C60|nr:RNA polymerase-binding protein DksA [uncultured Methylibium sp.]
MSKTPVKAAAKKSAKAPPKKAAAKPPVKAAAKKPVAKPPAKKAVAAKKPVAAKKAAAKPAPKPVPKPAAKPVAKPAVKASAKPAPAAKKPAPAPVTKKASAPPVPPTTPPQATPAPAATKTPTRLRSAKSAPTVSVDTHPPSIPLPPPSRPPASNVIDLPRPVRKIDPKLANVWKTKAGRDLSEDELMAMPDSEYMNDKQLEFFRVRLMQQRNDLLDNAGETTEHLREDTSIVPDPADRATIEEEHALELRTRDRERKLLKKISQSIARIEAGDYGYCDETGEPIGLGRLLARPTATLSLEAQQRREMKQKMFGD